MPISGVQQIYMAGGGSQAYRPSGVIYWQAPAVANAADNLFLTNTAYSLPAGTLSTNGDALIIETLCTGSSSSDNKAVVVNIGYSAWDTTAGFTGGLNVIVSGKTTASATHYSRAMVTRLSATTASYMSETRVVTATADLFDSTLYASGSLTWANALNILAEVRDVTPTGVAAVITLQEIRVTFVPR